MKKIQHRMLLVIVVSLLNVLSQAAADQTDLNLCVVQKRREVKQFSVVINDMDIVFSYPSYCIAKEERLNSSESFVNIMPEYNNEALSVTNFYRSNVKLIWLTDGKDMLAKLKRNNPQIAPIVLSNELTLLEIKSTEDSTWTQCIQVVITMKDGIILLAQSENRINGDTDDILYTVVDSLVHDATPLLPFVNVSVCDLNTPKNQ